MAAVTGDHMSARADTSCSCGSDPPTWNNSWSWTQPTLKASAAARRPDERPARRGELEPAWLHETTRAGADRMARSRAETDSKTCQSELKEVCWSGHFALPRVYSIVKMPALMASVSLYSLVCGQHGCSTTYSNKSKQTGWGHVSFTCFISFAYLL